MMGKRCKMKNIKNVNTNDISSNLDQELQAPPKEEQATDVNFDQINEEAQVRAKKRPIIQRIVKALQKDSSPFREVIINSEPLEKRVALLVDGVLDKFDLERTGEERIVGSIFQTENCIA